VDLVQGMFDATTRTAKVRCIFDNPDSFLRPQMYATVEISVDQKKALAIPRNAVMKLADFKVVFVQIGEEGGYLKFKSVSVDVDEGESSPYLEIKRGLSKGQQVVVNGGILLSQKL
jgi:multidrug efflux pump subunit AcrA (membrane-fusion protein)